MMKQKHGVSRRAFVGGVVAGVGALGFPAILRAES